MSVQRFLVALGIVLAGFAAAWPFRQSLPPPTAPAMAVTPLALTLRKADSPLELAPRIDVSPAVELAEAAPDQQAPPENWQTSADFLNLAPPPALPVSFQPASASTARNDWRPDASLTPPRPPAPPRPYRLRDGDTLEKIADRLLGDANRAGEIFEANRKVLAQPDLLPVGVVIMLPPRATTDSSTTFPVNGHRLTPPNE